MNKPPLSFQKGNAKLGPSVHTFSLPAGHTCPGAKDCLSTADLVPDGSAFNSMAHINP